MDGEPTIRLERTRTDKGWVFLISNQSKTYVHVDNIPFATREELDGRIEDWVHRNKKLTI